MPWLPPLQNRPDDVRGQPCHPQHLTHPPHLQFETARQFAGIPTLDERRTVLALGETQARTVLRNDGTAAMAYRLAAANPALTLDSTSASLAPGAEVELIVSALITCGFRLWDECLDLRDAHGRRAVLAGLEQFREHLGGELTLAMPDGLGARSDISTFDEVAFERALRELRALRTATPLPR